MNKKVVVILAACLLLLLVGAGVLYNSLAGIVEPGDVLGEVSVNEGSGEVSSDPGKPGSGETQPEDGRIEAPDFTVLDTDGNAVMLSDLRDKPVVLNFWASWCPPCKNEMPDFDAVYLELGEDVHFMMVDLIGSNGETVEKSKAHIEESGYSFPVYFDTTQEAAYLYGIRSIPTTYFIDKDGFVVTGAQGAINESALRKGIGMIWEAE